MGVSSFAAVGTVVVVIAIVLTVQVSRLGTTSSRDVRWLVGDLPISPAVGLLVRRYLVRVRVHRWIGGLVGASLALLVGLSSTRSIGVGIFGAGRSPVSEPLFAGLAGLLVGSVMAEVYRIRPTGNRRDAELISRQPEPDAVQVQPLTLVLVVTTLVVAAWQPNVRSVLLAAASVAILGLQHGVMRSIAGRRRPALPDDLRAGDELVRAFGARRFSVESLAAAVLVLGWQVAGTESAVPDVALSLVLVSVVAVVVVLVVRSRPYPSRRFR